MKKVFAFWAVVMAAVMLMCACSTSTPAKVRVAALKGPTGIGMAQLMDQAKQNKTQGKYEFTVAAAPDEVVSAVASGSVDIAAVPVNLAASLYAKTEGKVKLAAVNTLGVLYILENGDSVHSVADLKGKTLYATGQGSTPEYVLNAILEKNGLKVGEDVVIEYKAEHDELATLAASGEVTLAMLPEPNVTAAMAKNENLRIALDLTQQWESLELGTLVQGCIVVRDGFLQENPQAVQTFLTEYAASVDYVNGDPAAAGELVASAGIMPQAALAAKAIPNCNIVCIQGDEMKAMASSTLQVLFDANPKSVGGAMPDDGFYYLP